MTHKFNPIAIIGYSGRFPGAASIDELFELLKQGRDHVGSISEKRIKETTLPLDSEYINAGYLSDIDKFDYNFFNYAPIEAMSMDPHIRLTLENVYHCMEDSGYGPDFFRGTNTSVIAGGSYLEYYKLADDINPMLLTGNDLPFLSGTISRQFGLRGISTVTHSSCSSSMSAIQMAYDILNLGRSDHALVISSNLLLFPEKNTSLLGLESDEGKSKSFSAKADGMSNGEASVAILLKPLDKAIQDNDNIHAVLRAIGSNNDADLSASATAPDYISQSNLLKEVWQMADINPRDLGYIEAHGSGTQLGDSMEVLALNTSFKEYTQDKHFCSLSTIKTNIGHTKSASGIAGLSKAILSVEKGRLFSNLHFEEPSPLIDFNDAAVKVQTQLEDWNTKEGKKRLAGVTSMGLSGTNFHAVIEEAPNRLASDIKWSSPFLITVSAKSPEQLDRKLLQMQNTDFSTLELADITTTLVSGREHFKHRKCALITNKADLKKLISKEYSTSEKSHQNSKKTSLLLFAIQTGVNDKKRIEYFKSNYPEYQKDFDHCLTLAENPDNANVIELAAQYSFFNLIKNAGISIDRIISIGTGELLLKVINGESTLQKALNTAANTSGLTLNNLEARTQALLDREKKTGFPVFIDLGITSPISSQLNTLADHDSSFELLHHQDHEDPFLQILARWYQLGENLNWNYVGNIFGGKKISLPLYPFEKTRCWIRETPKTNRDGATQNSQSDPNVLQNVGDVELAIIELWKEVLDTNEVLVNDNFFEIGGNSLKTSRVIIELNEKYDIDLSFEDIFEFQTVTELADYIKDLMGFSYRLKLIWKKVLKLEEVNDNDHFFDLGGHSLLANNLINEIDREFKIKLNFEDIFKHPTFITQAEYLQNKESKSNDEFTPIEKIKEQNDYPLSIYQEQVWTSSKSNENISRAYNEPMTFWFHGTLNRNALEKAFNDLFTRHEILRTVFTEGNKTRQRIITLEEFTFKLDYKEYSSKEEKDVQDAVLHYTSKLFDLSEGPLLRVLLIKVSENKHVLSLVIHRTITDGWSKGIMMRELLAAYSAYSNGRTNPVTELKIQYKDYVAWEQKQLEGSDIEKSKNFWVKKFENTPTPVSLPNDKPYPKIKSYQGSILTHELDRGATQNLRKIGGQQGATMFMNLLTVVNILVYRYTNQNDITIGTPISNRKHSDLEDQLGAYANILALRTQFDQHISYNDLLHLVKEDTLSAYSHQGYPFYELLKELSLSNSPDNNPVFNIMVIAHNTESYNEKDLQKIGDLSIEGFMNGKSTNVKYDLIFDFFESNENVTMHVTYNTDIYTQNTIHKLIKDFDTLVREIIEKPNESIQFLVSSDVIIDKV